MYFSKIYINNIKSHYYYPLRTNEIAFLVVELYVANVLPSIVYNVYYLKMVRLAETCRSEY